MTSIFSQLLVPIYADLHIAVTAYLLPSLLPGMLALVTFDIAYLLFFRKRQKDYKIFLRSNQFILFIMFFYLAFIIYLTILSRPSGSRTGVDLMPLATLSDSLSGNIFAAENVLLFLPFGVIYCFLPIAGKRASQCRMTGFTISVSIEVVQYITKRGFLQTDDVILNVLGCYIGYIIGSRLIKLKDSFPLLSG